MQNDNGKAREYKVLLGAISFFAGLFSFYFIAESSYGILRGLFGGFLVSLLYPALADCTARLFGDFPLCINNKSSFPRTLNILFELPESKGSCQSSQAR
jgi:hypothetical protein